MKIYNAKQKFDGPHACISKGSIRGTEVEGWKMKIAMNDMLIVIRNKKTQ